MGIQGVASFCKLKPGKNAPQCEALITRAGRRPEFLGKSPHFTDDKLLVGERDSVIAVGGEHMLPHGECAFTAKP